MGVTWEEFNAFNCSSPIRTTLMYKLMAVQWTGLMLGFQVWVYAISRKGIEHLGITLVLFSLWTSSLGKKRRAACNYISRLRAVSLFFVVDRAKRETRKWPRAWLMACIALTKSEEKERLLAVYYISGIWISALKKSMQNADWWRWH